MRRLHSRPLLPVWNGAAAVVWPSLFLPPDLRTPFTSHLIQEQGAGFVFIGAMSMWCARHFERRGVVHAGLIVFTALFAAIHWAGYLRDGRSLLSRLVNSVPFALFLITSPRPGSAAQALRV